LAGREDALRTEEAPDDGCTEEGFGGGTAEVRLLLEGADVLDVGEGEVEHCDLDEAGDRGGYDLGHEHRLGRDFHVVAAESLLTKSSK